MAFAALAWVREGIRVKVKALTLYDAQPKAVPSPSVHRGELT
jgi:hypothetical protein